MRNIKNIHQIKLDTIELTLCSLKQCPFFIIDFRKRETEKERQKYQFVVSIIYVFIGCFLYVP